MKLRWMIFCYKNGDKDSPILQYYNEKWDYWETLETVEVEEDDNE